MQGCPQTKTTVWLEEQINLIFLHKNNPFTAEPGHLKLVRKFSGSTSSDRIKRETDGQRKGINKWPCQGQAVMGWYKRGCGFPEGVCSRPVLVCLGAYHHLLCPFSKPQHTSSDIHTNTLDVWHLSGWKGWKDSQG